MKLVSKLLSMHIWPHNPSRTAHTKAKLKENFNLPTVIRTGLPICSGGGGGGGSKGGAAGGGKGRCPGGKGSDGLGGMAGSGLVGNFGAANGTDRGRGADTEEHT
jgi:hypothetical protein